MEINYDLIIKYLVNKKSKFINKKQFITIKKTGHFSFIDRPEKMIELILINEYGYLI